MKAGRQEHGFFCSSRGASVARHVVRCCVRYQRLRYALLRLVLSTRTIKARASDKSACCEHVGVRWMLWYGHINGKLRISSVKATLARPTEPISGSRTLSHHPGPSHENFQSSLGKSSIETTKATPPPHPRTISPKEVARAALAPNSQALPGAERAAGAPRGRGSPWWA